jgi:uncharacterized protein (TIGR02246 family)
MKLGELARVSSCVALIALSPGTIAGNASIAPVWARDFLIEWYSSYNAGDAARVASLFTADAILGSDKGRTAIETGLARAFAATDFKCSGYFESFRQIEGLAVGWGVDTCTETQKADGTRRRSKERWLIVLERQGDGKWLIARETWEDLRR